MSSRDRVDRLLFGRDVLLSTKLVQSAGVLFVVSLLVYLAVRSFSSLALTEPPVTVALVLAMFVVATGSAYRNDGALVSVALAAGIGLGFYLPAIAYHLGEPGDVTLWVLAVGTISSVLVGAVGFVAGAVLRRLLG
jgi:hypothetical protein